MQETGGSNGGEGGMRGGESKDGRTDGWMFGVLFFWGGEG